VRYLFITFGPLIQIRRCIRRESLSVAHRDAHFHVLIGTPTVPLVAQGMLNEITGRRLVCP